MHRINDTHYGLGFLRKWADKENNEDNYGGDLVRRHGFAAVSPRVYLTVLSALLLTSDPIRIRAQSPISDLSQRSTSISTLRYVLLSFPVLDSYILFSS